MPSFEVTAEELSAAGGLVAASDTELSAGRSSVKGMRRRRPPTRGSLPTSCKTGSQLTRRSSGPNRSRSASTAPGSDRGASLTPRDWSAVV